MCVRLNILIIIRFLKCIVHMVNSWHQAPCIKHSYTWTALFVQFEHVESCFQVYDANAGKHMIEPSIWNIIWVMFYMNSVHIVFSQRIITNSKGDTDTYIIITYDLMQHLWFTISMFFVCVGSAIVNVSYWKPDAKRE